MIFLKKTIDTAFFLVYNIYRCIIQFMLYGEIAQLARATGSYPVGHEFKSHSRYQNRLLKYRQLSSARWSRGQDDALSRRNHGFNSRTGHQNKALQTRDLQGFVIF